MIDNSISNGRIFCAKHRRNRISEAVLLITLLFVGPAFGQRNQPELPNQGETKSFVYSQGWKKSQESSLMSFRSWAEQYVDHSAAGGANSSEVSKGVELARERKEAFIQLIKSNPERALALAVPASIRKSLPPEVVRELEVRVSGTGDLSVIAELTATGGGAVQPIQRFVDLGGQRYRAFVFGRRLEQVSKNGIPLHGVAIDGILALAASSIRELEPGEDPNPARPIIDVKANAGGKVSEPILGEAGETTYRFASREDLIALEAELEGAESGIGPDVKRTASPAVPSEPNSSPQAEGPGPNAWTTGNKNVLIIRVDFSDLPGDPRSRGGTIYTAGYVQNFADTKIKPYYVASSYNLTTLTNTPTTQLYRLPQTAGYYATTSGGVDQLHTAARSAASANYTLANYDRVMVLFSWLGDFSGSNITFGGRAEIGGSKVWINGEFDFRVVSHELGHTYGLYHAGLWQVSDGNPISSAGHNVQYGDEFDTMGENQANDTRTDFNPYYKNIIGWISNSQIQTVTTSGTYRINRFDNVSSTGTFALKVAKDSGRTYWIACRRNFTTNSSMQNGAYITWAYGSSVGGSKSDLLDMTTPGDSDQDAALAIGSTFTDSGIGVTFWPVSKGGAGATQYLDVKVTFGVDGGQELITNGGFESGTTGWTKNGNAYIAASTYPHAGSYYAYLGNEDNASGNLFNSVSVAIPADATSATLSFWLNISSEEDDSIGYDIMHVNLLPASGGSVSIATYSNTNKDANPGNPYYSKRSFDVTAYKGQSVKVYFDVSTDSQLPTIFRLDDVSLKVTLPTTSSAAGKADFNKDGNSDLIWQNNNTGQRYLWLMTGTELSQNINLGFVSTEWDIVGTGDFNGDKQEDIVWQNRNSGQRYLWLMTGVEHSQNINLGFVSTDWDIVGTGDFNGDKKVDIVWQNRNSGQRYLWLMTGAEHSQNVNLGFVSREWDIVGTGDFNGDKQVDILWQNRNSGQRYLWLMTGTEHSQNVNLGFVSTDWDIAGTGDFNGDKQVDIVWQNRNSGQRYLWLMTHTERTGTVNLGYVPTEWKIRNH